MKHRILHEKAIRLLEGGAVEIDNHVVRAIFVPDGFDACMECDMDCLCKGDIANLCTEVCWIADSQYLLKLA